MSAEPAGPCLNCGTELHGRRIFMALAIRRLSYATRLTVVTAVVELAAFVFLAGYWLFAFRRVYGDSWWKVVAKSLGIAVLYLVAGMIGVLAAVTWAALT